MSVLVTETVPFSLSKRALLSRIPVKSLVPLVPLITLSASVKPGHAGSADAVVLVVVDVHARQRDAAGVVEHDRRYRPAVAAESSAPVRVLDDPPEQPLVFAFVHVPADARHGQRAVRAGVAQRDAAVGAVGGDALELSGVPPTSVSLTLSALPAPVSIVLPVPVTFSVPLVGRADAGAAGGVDVEAAAGDSERVAVARAHDDRVVLARIEGLGGVADDGRAAGVPGDGDAAVLLVASVSPVSVIGPLNVTVPPVRPVISAVLPCRC